jgi:TolB-like protein
MMFTCSRRIALLVFVVLFCQPVQSAWAAAREVRMAIVSPVSQEDSQLRRSVARQITSSLEFRLQSEKSIRLIDRNNLDAVLQEHKMVLSGLVEGTIRGGLVKADYLVSGHFQMEGQMIRISLLLIEVDSGKIRFTTRMEGRADLAIYRKIEAAAGLFAAEVLGRRTIPVDFTSEPRESAVYINGNYIGDTPIYKYYLPPEKIRINISKPYYRDWEEELDLSNSTGQKVNADLIRKLEDGRPFRIELGYHLLQHTTENEIQRLDEGFSFWVGRAFSLWDLQAGFTYHSAGRKESFQAFSQQVTERRDIRNANFSIRLIGHLPVSERWLYLFGSIHGGLSIINESLYIPDDSSIEETLGLKDSLAEEYYDKNYRASSTDPYGGFSLGLLFFPNQPVSLRLYAAYDVRPSYISKNGQFNPLGQKRFLDASINPSWGYIGIAARYAFGQGRYWE